ncbi:phage portal protein, HK97 family [Escherichia coli EC96038]|nr:phage portal protein, HK97 family [Escherichia coli EC96038]
MMPVKIRLRRPGKEFQPNCLTAHLTVIRQSVKQSMVR